MTHGTIGGILVSDLVLGRENPWEEVFDPSRLATQSLKEAVPEIIDSTLPYVDWLTGGEVGSVDEIEIGNGAIIREGLKEDRRLPRRGREALQAQRRVHAYGVYRAV